MFTVDKTPIISELALINNSLLFIRSFKEKREFLKIPLKKVAFIINITVPSMRQIEKLNMWLTPRQYVLLSNFLQVFPALEKLQDNYPYTEGQLGKSKLEFYRKQLRFKFIHLSETFLNMPVKEGTIGSKDYKISRSTVEALTAGETIRLEVDNYKRAQKYLYEIGLKMNPRREFSTKKITETELRVTRLV